MEAGFADQGVRDDSWNLVAVYRKDRMTEKAAARFGMGGGFPFGM